MLASIRNVLRRRPSDLRPAPAAPAVAAAARAVPPVEPLEARRLMAAGGPVVAQQFVGTVDAVTAVVLTFDVPLDPATAQNVEAYRLVRKERSTDDGFGGDGESSTDASRIRLSSAVYDAAANTVTLTPVRPSFELRKSFTVIQVQGTGKDAVLTPGGAALDGDGDGRPGGDATVRFKSAARRTLSFREADGDRVRLRVDGGGHMLYFLPTRGRSAPALFLRETNPGTSVLSGTVTQGKRGDGVIDIAQVGAASTAQVPIATDPAFRIRSLVP